MGDSPRGWASRPGEGGAAEAQKKRTAIPRSTLYQRRTTQCFGELVPFILCAEGHVLLGNWALLLPGREDKFKLSFRATRLFPTTCGEIIATGRIRHY